MYVKKLRRKCGVRGCKNIDTYSVSLSREAGNTVIICKSCLGKALGAIDDVVEDKSARVSHTEAPALFFNSRLASGAPAEAVEEVIDDEVEVVEEASAEAVEEAPVEAVEEAPVEAQPEGFVCPHCGQVCKSEQGMQAHIRNKHKGDA